MKDEKEIDPANIAAIFLDEEKMERLVFTRDQLINQLQRVCPEINSSFDTVFAEEFKSLSSDLSEVLPIWFIGSKKALEEKNHLLQTCGDLLWNSANTVIASVQTLRCGFRLQSGILIRSVVEMCATVVHLLAKPEILDDFLNDKLKSTKSISIADKQIPLFGLIWGVLSKKQMHINSLHADMYPLVKYTNKDEVPASVTLGMLGATILILAIVTELTFIHEIESPRYWEIVGKGQFRFIPPQGDSWASQLLKKK
jgi:hypothetical protein